VAEFRAVCRAEALPPGEARLVRAAGRELALFNIDGTFHAMEDTCLHAGGPLHEGTLRGNVVICPWHQWEFDVTNGACNLNPVVSLDTFEVRIRDGAVEIRV
jgi:nitrite reductase/ring-hydroxylating ferredoxin subunit